VPTRNGSDKSRSGHRRPPMRISSETQNGLGALGRVLGFRPVRFDTAPRPRMGEEKTSNASARSLLLMTACRLATAVSSLSSPQRTSVDVPGAEVQAKSNGVSSQLSPHLDQPPPAVFL